MSMSEGSYDDYLSDEIEIEDFGDTRVHEAKYKLEILRLLNEIAFHLEDIKSKGSREF